MTSLDPRMIALALAICVLGGLPSMAATAATGDPAESASKAGWVDDTRLNNADREPGQWLTTGRDLSAAYYSPLSDINRANVKSLGFAWEYRLGTRRGLEATPLVVDGVMYASGNWGAVLALDASNGKLRWTYNPGGNLQVARFEQNDVVNRGVVVWKGRVYVISPDCRLIALDAATGTKYWEADSLIDHAQPYVCSGAPQVAGNVILVGNGGADTTPGGLRGYVTAYDVATGAYRWRFFTVPSLLDKDPTPELASAAATWNPKRDLSYGGGGNVWNAMAFDPTLGLVFFGTGNAAPYGAPRDEKGHGTDNLYAASILALHADSGKMAWYFQTTPGDRWDFDATANLVLADLVIDGKKRATLLQANKNGYFYVLDRATGKPISAKPYAYVNWSLGLDSNFRPLITSTSDYHSSPKLIYPSVEGAHSWTPMAFSPRTGLAYVPVIDAPNFLVDLTHNPGSSISFIDEATSGAAYIVPDHDYDAAAWAPVVGQLPSVPALNPHNGKARVRSSLKAWDPITQKVVWERETSTDYLVVDGGTLVTGGDVVFAGREDGMFVAYDARTGEVLRKLATGTPIMAAPMTYKVDSTQYVAVLGAHGGGYLGSFVGTAAMKYVNEGRILAFKVEGAPEVPKPEQRVDEPYRQPPVHEGTVAQTAAGMKLFNTWCARCHSLGTPGVTPDLSRLKDGIDNVAVFQAIVLKGAFLSRGMARFDDVLSGADTEALHAYLVDQAWQFFRKQPATAAGAAPGSRGNH
jgi:quinohemoprotein ethanol dehydrogenase